MLNSSPEYKINLPLDALVVDIGSRIKANYVPAELCEILPNQAFKGKLSDQHTASMITYACNPPAKNARSIVGDGLQYLGLLGTQTLKNFGLDVNKNMTIVPARILSPPRISYASNASAGIIAEKASWNLRGVKFFKGAQLKNWGVFAVITSQNDFKSPADPELAALIQTFKKACTDSGMATVDPTKVHGAKVQPNDPKLHDVLRNGLSVLAQLKLSYVLVILSDTNKRVYAAIRNICDRELGLLATCAVSSKIRKQQLQYMANLALKINPKLGGVNHALSTEGIGATWLKKEVTMLVGMDVTHPG